MSTLLVILSFIILVIIITVPLFDGKSILCCWMSRSLGMPIQHALFFFLLVAGLIVGAFIRFPIALMLLAAFLIQAKITFMISKKVFYNAK